MDRWRDTVTHECRHAGVHQDNLRHSVDRLEPRAGFGYMSRVREAIRERAMFELSPSQEKRFQEAARLMKRQFVDWRAEPGFGERLSNMYGVPVEELAAVAARTPGAGIRAQGAAG
jgi:hypothetical protein